MKLTELDRLHSELLDRIFEATEDDDPSELLELYDRLTQQLETKTDNIVGSIKALEGEITYLKSRRDEFNQKIKVRENNLKRFKEWLINHLLSTEKDELRGKESVIKVVANGGKNPIQINEVDPVELPAQYTKLEIDKDAITEALQSVDTLVVNGLVVAEKLPKGVHLRVK